MKRRFISILMALVMALSLLPAQALADDNTVTELNKNNISTYVTNGLGNGTYKLSDDVEITTTLTITGETTLDLNNHVLQMTNNGGSVFVIENGGHLTLTDSTPEANKTMRYFSVDSNTGLWTLLTDGSTSAYSVSGGIITGGSAEYAGGVMIKPGGKLTLESGNIVGCQASGQTAGAGGGVKVESGGTFTMENDAAIIGCVANSGGGVMTDNADDTIYGEFIMNGGTIANCKTTERWGGGVYASGPFTMNGGVITNCEAFELGGGVFLGRSTSPHTLNGTITSGNATDQKYIFANSTHVSIGETAVINANITLEGGTLEMDANAKFNGTATVSGTMYTPVATAGEFAAALKNTGVSTIRLTSNIILTSNSAYDMPLITRNLTIDLNDKVLKLMDNGFKVGSGGHLTLTDTAETKTPKYFIRDTDTGLWKLTDSSTAYTVSGGVITGGKGYKEGNDAYGGGVYVESNGQLTMTGGNIVGCEARGDNAYGGGVYVAPGGTFEMSGGSITGCTAVATTSGGFACGGGIRNDGEVQSSNVGHTTLSGTAVIRDCHAKGAGSGFYILSGGGVSDAGTLNISGDVTIIDCTADGDSDAMYVNGNNGSSVTGGTFYGSIKGRDKITGHTVTYRLNNEDYATQVVQPNGKTSIPDPSKADHTFDGWYTADGTKWNSNNTVTEDLTLTGLLYVEAEDAGKLTDAMADKSIEAIRLTQDITLSSGSQNTGINVAADSKIVLDLNGHVLDLGKKYVSLAYDGISNPYAKKQLTIMDSKPTQEHRFTDNNGLWVLDANGDKTVTGGVITGGSADKGGAVCIETNGTVIMIGGNIVGCSASENGGAVYMNGIAFEMNSGAIIGCKAANGGGVFVKAGGTFTMSGGSIADCKATNGSAIYLNGSRMNANGGTVNGTVLVDVEKTTSSTNTGSIGGSGTNATQFNGTVTNYGEIGHGTFNGLIINNNAKAQFSGAYSPQGIVGKKPTGTNGHTYYTVTFDPADSTMDYTTRYFLDGGNISDQIKPATRTGYTFAGWYNDETKWDHATDTVTEDMTLTAHWTACDHKTSISQPTCTAGTTCTVCGGEIKALGHDWGAWVSNNDNTHTRTCTRDSAHTETNNCADTNKDHNCDLCGATLSQHSGGTASCAAPATCAYCGQPYGAKDPANHSDLRHVPAKDATTQAEGNSEYWLCSGCGKCYKDAAAAEEIALADTVIAKRIPRRYSGPTITVVGAAYYDGGNVGLTFISSAGFDTFKGVQVDGKTLAAKNYIAERGSIEVYLKAVYLRTLKNGSHTVTILSTEGDVSAVFTVDIGKTSPGTFDPGVTVYALSSALSLTGLALLRRRKEEN